MEANHGSSEARIQAAMWRGNDRALGGIARPLGGKTRTLGSTYRLAGAPQEGEAHQRAFH